MREALITEVMQPDGKEHELRVEATDNDTLDFYIDNKLIFSGDWSGNFLPSIERALKIWKVEEA